MAPLPGRALMAVVAAGLLPPGAAQARPPAAPDALVVAADHDAALDDLMRAMRVEDNFSRIMPQIIDTMVVRLMVGNAGHDAEVRTIVGEELTTAFTLQLPKLVAGVRQVYSETFTTPELREVADFFRSSIGQKVIDRTPDITRKSMEMGMDIGREAAMESLPHIIERMRKRRLTVPTI